VSGPLPSPRSEPGSGLNRVVIVWFGATVALGALLLFMAEPVIGRLLVPRLGGAPAVWGTCMVFFQTCVLVGYAYAHILGERAPVALQPVIHAAVCAASVALLPLAIPDGAPPPEQTFPALWILGRLIVSVGLPFFALSATAPLVQMWLSRTRHPSAPDPYFLYALSNAGSLVALLCYPGIVEPWLALRQQLVAWSWGYGALLALEVGCAVWLLAMRAGPAAAPPVPVEPCARPGRRDYGLWLLLAFVPSSLMLGVTTYATTDLAPVPLLWVGPLAIYLGTYVLAFMRKPPIGHARMLGAMPAAILAVAFLSLVGATKPFWLLLLVHLAGLFVIAMACHGELARYRPGPRHLTAFYLVVSVGGALGGLFNGLLAPWLFRSVIEYPLALVAACIVRILTMPAVPPSPTWQVIAGHQQPRSRAHVLARQAILPCVLLVTATVTILFTRNLDESWRLLAASQVATAFCVIAYSMRRRPARFAWAAGALLIAPSLAARTENTIYFGRSFFGVHRVTYEPQMKCNVYTHGTTIHGVQSTLPDRRHVAGAYYHATGPAGDVLARSGPWQVGIIGLGVGTLAAYARAGQTYTYLEIDPVVAEIAETPALFSYLADARSRGADVRVVLGDGRRCLDGMRDGLYDVLVLDAYSSDTVPIHLVTREAMALYLRKLAPHGLIAMNVSSRYLDLGPVLSALAQQAGLQGLERLDTLESAADQNAARHDGKAVSRWIVLGRTTQDLAPIMGAGSAWGPLAPSSSRAWTDDRANILSAIAW
jgi:hypothetical protein